MVVKLEIIITNFYNTSGYTLRGLYGYMRRAEVNLNIFKISIFSRGEFFWKSGGTLSQNSY